MGLLDKLKLPEVRNAASLDDAALSLLHRQIICKKNFLKRIYVIFFQEPMGAVPIALQVKPLPALDILLQQAREKLLLEDSRKATSS